MKILQVSKILNSGTVKAKDMLEREYHFLTSIPLKNGDYVVESGGIIVRKIKKVNLRTVQV